MLDHLILYIIAFAGIWFGAGLAISSVERLSHKLRLSSFIISFLVLGFFTSIGEFSVGVNAVLSNDPGIFVGNLIGGSIVLLLMVIPLLAITGRDIHIGKEIKGYNLAFPLVVVGMPVVLAFDGAITRTDGMIVVLMYVVSTLIIQPQKSKEKQFITIMRLTNFSLAKELGKIVAGAAIIFFASHIVVDQTMYFSKLLGWTPFFISLLIISLGTNLPELSLIARSMFLKSNQVAFGDYLGSASFNSFLFGLLTLWYGKTIRLTNSYLVSLLFLIVGLGMFYAYARSKETLNKKEAWILLGVYVLFVYTEFLIHLPK